MLQTLTHSLARESTSAGDNAHIVVSWLRNGMVNMAPLDDSKATEGVAYVGPFSEGQTHVMNLRNDASFMDRVKDDFPEGASDELCAAADFIEEQQSEIERLRAECRDKAGVLKHLDWMILTRTRIVVQQVADFLEGLADD